MIEVEFVSFDTMWEHLGVAKIKRHCVRLPERLVHRLESGKPMRLKTLNGETSRKRKLEDFPFCEVMVLSEKAKVAVEVLLGPFGQFVPLVLTRKGECIKQSYWVYNCTTTCRAVNGRYDVTEGMEFSFRRIPKRVHAFRPSEDLTTMFISIAVQNVIEDSNLSGWSFWDVTGKFRSQQSPIRP